MSLKTNYFYEFKNFRLDPVEKVLLHAEKPLSITPKAFRLLEILVENHGHIVEKKKLLAEVWADSFVEEGNLTFNVRMIRKALNDDAQNPKFIETVPRRGYRFIAEVKEISAGQSLDSESFAVEPKSFQPIKKEKVFIKQKSARRYLFLAIAFALIGTSIVGWRYAHGKNSTGAPILDAAFSSEKLSTNGQVALAVISPDGKNVVYINSSGGKQSIWLRQLDSSSNVEIIPPADDVYGGLVFSPDGNSLYFCRRTKGVEDKGDIYRASVFGGALTKIVDQA